MPHTDSSDPIRYRLFPFLSWLHGYRFASFRSDTLAGLTVATVLIPQAMAYAMLAGLPPIYGLYAAAVTPLIGALWGSLRQLATGPNAIMSLLVFSTLSPMVEPGSALYIEHALLLSFVIGVLYLSIGLFRLGELMYFISHSTIKGFTAAAALIIIATQLPHFFGFTVSRHEYMFPMLLELFQEFPGLHMHTVAIGSAAFVLIYSLKKYRPNLPSGLLAIVLATVVVYVFDLHQEGVVIVGASPGGFPLPRLPAFDLAVVSSLLGPAVVIAIVSFAETYSIGKIISAQTKQKVDVNQEFVGQGLANLIGSFFQSYPVAGSFARTAINHATGAKTGISSAISSLIVIIALLFLTPLFTYIPRAALAALIISAVLILFHPKEIIRLWKMNRHDGIVASTVFVLAFLVKPDYALLIGVIMSLMLFLWKTMHPRIVRITKDPAHNMFVNADVHNLPGCPQILHLRPDNVIFFANAEYTMEHIWGFIDRQDTPLKFLLLDFQAIGFIDITAIDELRVLNDDTKKRGMALSFLSVHLPVRNVFESSGFFDELGPDCVIEENREDAIWCLFQHLDHDYCKHTCPHTLFLECGMVK